MDFPPRNPTIPTYINTTSSSCNSDSEFQTPLLSSSSSSFSTSSYAASFIFMACLDTLTIITMYNHHHHHQQSSDHPKSSINPPISPRISFSHDFAEPLHSRPQILKSNRDYSAPVSSDFEFSVSNNSMMTADELFFKGRLLPFKDSSGGSGSGIGIGQKTTLRDELLARDDDDVSIGGGMFRPPKASSGTRWKGFLGLRKSHIGSKRSEKGDGSGSGSVSGQDDVHGSKGSQETMSQGGGSSNCRDMEFRMQ